MFRCKSRFKYLRIIEFVLSISIWWESGNDSNGFLNVSVIGMLLKLMSYFLISIEHQTFNYERSEQSLISEIAVGYHSIMLFFVLLSWLMISYALLTEKEWLSNKTTWFIRTCCNAICSTTLSHLVYFCEQLT